MGEEEEEDMEGRRRGEKEIMRRRERRIGEKERKVERGTYWFVCGDL
jgi:hypothetical protein